MSAGSGEILGGQQPGQHTAVWERSRDIIVTDDQWSAEMWMGVWGRAGWGVGGGGQLATHWDKQEKWQDFFFY